MAVSEDALLVSLGDPLREDSRVLTVEEEVYPCEFAVLALLVVPLSCVDVALVVVAAYQDGSPQAAAGVVSPQALAWNGVERASDGVISVLDPFVREAAVIFGVIERLERQPVGLMDLGVFIVDSLFMNII